MKIKNPPQPHAKTPIKRLAAIYDKDLLHNDFNSKLIREAKEALGIPSNIATRNLSEAQKNEIIDYWTAIEKSK
jgi:hypothetical protein